MFEENGDTFPLFALLGFRSTLLRAPHYFGYHRCCQNWDTFTMLPQNFNFTHWNPIFKRETPCSVRVWAGFVTETWQPWLPQQPASTAPAYYLNRVNNFISLN